MITFFKKYGWFVVIVSTFYVLMYFLIDAPKQKYRDYYFSTFKFNFRGKITAIKEIDHNSGYLCLDLISSDIQNFNPSDSLDDYTCIIDNKRAIVKITGIKNINLGEIYEEKSDSCFIYSKGGIMIDKGGSSLVDWIQPPKSFDMCK